MRTRDLLKRCYLLFTLFIAIPTMAQDSTVTGTVTDSSNGQPLPGVSIIEVGTTNGTTTDFDGNYSITVNTNGSLLFSYLGYQRQTIMVSGRTSINLALAPGEQLDEVIVTGVFDQRTRMEASVAISVLGPELLENQVANSAADLLKNVPGVFVNSSLGEIRNTVYSRGVSVGSNDGASGYFYVSMQEDGLPVTNATFGNYGPDYYLRSDATLDRLEAVRGGTASILGNNAPGGIFNYVSKTGGMAFGGEVRMKYGLEGNGQNPYYRADFNLGGPIGNDDTWRYNIGGFLRQGDGARHPGYPMNNGGQLRANIKKIFEKGSITFHAKYLDDKNAWFEFLPAFNFEDPQLPEGWEQTNSVLIPSVKATARVNQSDQIIDYDSEDKIHSKDAAFQINFDYDLGNSWKFNSNMRYSKKSSEWNTTAVAYPFAVNGLVWYAIAGQLGQFGDYSFKDLVSGQELANITQAPNIVNGNFAGFNFITNVDNLPGAEVQPTSTLFNPLFYQDNQMKEFINQSTLTKKLENMSFTGGVFYAQSNLNRMASTGLGTMHTQLTRPTPTPTAITYTDFGGNEFQLTNPDGVIGGGGRSAVTNIIASTQKQTALFFGHNWELSDQLNFDWGIRYEKIRISGRNDIAAERPTSTPGGTDGNPSTLYDNTEGFIDRQYWYDETVNTFSFSGGLNYQFSEEFAIYGRYSEGRKAPDMDIYLAIDSDAASRFLDPIAQEISQIEVGLKLREENVSLFVTPFYSVLGNVASRQLAQENDDITSTYNTPTLFNKYKTGGVEIESIYDFSESFSIRAVATFQKSTASEFRVWDTGANGQADDTIIDFSGNDAGNFANTILRVSPTYKSGKFYTSADWSFLGDRQANVPNTFVLPAFHQTNLNLSYRFTENIQAQLTINNLFNQDGVMGWSAPGGFPAALDRDGFLPEELAANPNAVYSTLSLPPRAFFLSLNYTF